MDSYEVMWKRDTSGKCPDDEDEGSISFSGSSTSYTIQGLEEDSNYTVKITSKNVFGVFSSEPINKMTKKAGIKICNISILSWL